ncbi:MAG: hypothetical protein Q7O66_00975 [Dehalococcoidia bacterium]|nr:hypothetical protein [Dehalococcoidia bacterium]
MESGKIKTALEIALERADRLGAASTEELRRQEEEKHRLIGKGLAERYLVGLPLREVEEQIKKISGAAMAKGSFLETLGDAIGPVDSAREQSLLNAILFFAASESVQSLVNEITQLQRLNFSSEERDLRARREELAGEATALYETWGIAGSAVMVNIDVNEGWLRAQADLEAAAEDRLTPLRLRLKLAIASL